MCACDLHACVVCISDGIFRKANLISVTICPLKPFYKDICQPTNRVCCVCESAHCVRKWYSFASVCACIFLRQIHWNALCLGSHFKRWCLACDLKCCKITEIMKLKSEESHKITHNGGLKSFHAQNYYYCFCIQSKSSTSSGPSTLEMRLVFSIRVAHRV